MEKYPNILFRGLNLLLQLMMIDFLSAKFIDKHPIIETVIAVFTHYWEAHVKNKYFAPLIGLSYLAIIQITSLFSKMTPLISLCLFFELSIYYCLMQTLVLHVTHLLNLSKFENAMLMHFSIYFSWHTMYCIKHFPKCTISRLQVTTSALFYTFAFVPILIYSSSPESETNNAMCHHFQGWIAADAVHFIHYKLWQNKYNILKLK